MIRRPLPPRPAWGAAFVLALFVGLLYYPLLFTNRVLASGDILLYFYPYRDYAAAALRNGEIPLWNPYIFMGAPFLANPQAAVLYPLHWPLIWLPVTQQIYWSAAIHTWLLGFGLYLLLRRFQLTAWGSLAGGLVLAGCGFYGGLLGHINQMNAAAWLPWALLILGIGAFETENEKPKTKNGKGAGFALVVALMLLAGHTQTAYINLFGVGVWLVWSAVMQLPSWRVTSATIRSLVAKLFSPLLVYGVGAVLGGLLCAAQLLPTLELNGLGLRGGGLSYGEATSFSLRPLRLPWTLLPSYGAIDLGAIFGAGYTEFVGYVGLLGLLLALIGAWRGRGPARHLGLFFAALGLFLALGRWNPVYYLLYWLVPGFDLFRVPARWLMLYSFGMAVLAGVGIDWFIGRLRDVEIKRFSMQSPVTLSPLHLVTLSSCLLVFLSVDLLLAAQALPHRQTTAPQAVYETRTAPAHLLTDPVRNEVGVGAMGRFLGMSTITYDPGDMADWRRILAEGESPQLDARAFEQFIIGLKIQELIVPNLSLFWRLPAVDGFDGGVLPLQRYNQFLTLFIPPDQLVPDGRLREQIKTMPGADLLGLLNVQYVITDKVRDLWFEDVFYDRQIGARLTADQSTLMVEAPQPFAATHIDLIGYVEGDPAALDDAQLPVLAVTPITDQGATTPLLVTAGDQPGAALADPALDSPRAQSSGAVVAFQDVEQSRQTYRVRLTLPAPTTPAALQLQRLDQPLNVVIQAITLYDIRTKMFVPLLPSDRGRFRLVHSGDVKIYENLDVRPRAYLVHQVHSATTADEAFAYVQDDHAVQAGQAAVVEADLTLNTQPTPDDTAEIVQYGPEEVVVQTRSKAEALLVLSDTAYPGWQATVDGAPTTIYTTNYLFRGVRVPAGEHEVRFVYAPTSWQRGLIISSIALLCWVGLLGAATLRRSTQRATP
ncbi:MAG: hypothetical protein DYG89_14155 [Caldilinea sp. CFX5]|nr:hypothetical protein [Caldilinea sp. CFX5]